MTNYFQARITYSANWAKDGQEYTTTEGFQDQGFLDSYLQSMGWRITNVEKVA